MSQWGDKHVQFITPTEIPTEMPTEMLSLYCPDHVEDEGGCMADEGACHLERVEDEG